MNTDMSTLDNIAMEDSIAEICTADAAKIFIQTIISKFQDQYTIEDPERVQKAILPVVHALHGLKKKGYDMTHYAHQVVKMATAEYENYGGSKQDLAHKSTLIVTDKVIYHRDTGYFKKRE